MPEAITPELFDHLAELAALDLQPHEKEYLRAQLNGQLKAIQELERIPMPAGVPPAAHGVPYPPENRPPLRADEAWVDAALAQRILAQAPQLEDGYFVVPDIPHQALE
ncbi:MAG: aspartyl/glutamyl-tRNA amidotransferase subunit C [Anaerolineales bacterium]